jgi:hypothetical protein
LPQISVANLAEAPVNTPIDVPVVIGVAICSIKGCQPVKRKIFINKWLDPTLTADDKVAAVRAIPRLCLSSQPDFLAPSQVAKKVAKKPAALGNLRLTAPPTAPVTKLII